MKHSLLAIALIGVGLVSGTNAGAQVAPDSSTPVTVTGCLAQSDNPNAFMIKDSTGKIYGLMSSSVKLKPHVGHQVTITGTPMRPDTSETKSSHELSGQLQVSDLKMVSATCP